MRLRYLVGIPTIIITVVYYFIVWSMFKSSHVHWYNWIVLFILGIISLVANTIMDMAMEGEKSYWSFVEKFWVIVSAINFIIFLLLRVLNVIKVPNNLILSTLLGIWFFIGVFASLIWQFSDWGWARPDRM